MSCDRPGRRHTPQSRPRYLTVQAADTITFESTLDDITASACWRLTTPLRRDLTGLDGLTVAGDRFATASGRGHRRSLPEPWCWKPIWN
ncbi:MAG: hypothetical protein R3C12_19345 [Planctomycetaceae bacterium]